MECDPWNTQINFQFAFTFQQLTQTIGRRLSQKLVMKVKEKQIKGETFGLWSDLSDCNSWVKAKDCREEAEVRVGAVIREAELKKQTRGDLKVEEAWHERGNPRCLKWFVSHWDQPWELCFLWICSEAFPVLAASFIPEGINSPEKVGCSFQNYNHRISERGKWDGACLSTKHPLIFLYLLIYFFQSSSQGRGEGGW